MTAIPRYIRNPVRKSTEISVSEINPGEMVSVETDGEKATSITVSDMSAMGQPGQNSQDTSSGK